MIHNYHQLTHTQEDTDMITDLFEYATRNKLRYPSCIGELTTEQLYDLPLTASSPKGHDRLDLDKVARTITAELRSITEESFVKTSTNPREKVLTAALEVVKYIITYKQEQEKARADKAAKATKRTLYLEAYEAKQKAEVSSKSSEELLALLKALDDE